MNLLISVILPVYNGEDYIAKAIESILSQSYTNFELIIINDASTDNTELVINEYIKRDTRINYIKNRCNLKVVDSLNKGISLATGKYIARMDADDISLKDRFTEQIKFLEDNPHITMCDVLMEYINEKGESLNKFNSKCYEPDIIRQKIAKQNVLGHSSIMIRTDVLKSYRYNKTWYEDYELWLRLISDGHNIAKIEMPLLLYRIHSTSITGMTKVNKTHFYKSGLAKASFIRTQIYRFRWNWFSTRVFAYMLYDFLLYFYKKIK